METEYLAHIRKDGTKWITQSIREHCVHTAEYAEKRMKGTGFEKTAYLSGLLHDMGKYSDLFQEYLRVSVEGKKWDGIKVNHTFAGVIYILEKFHEEKKSYVSLASEVIAYAAGAHHGEFDCISPDNKNGFVHRLRADREEIQFSMALERYMKYCADEADIEALFALSVQEVQRFFGQVRKDCQETMEKEPGCSNTAILFSLGMMTRMILSAVMCADRTDTIEFMSKNEKKCRKTVRFSWKKQLYYMEEKINQFSCDTAINIQRKRISEQCRQFVEQGDGIYRISVPTGAGKTLATLRYALALAQKTEKKRILFAIPLLSVLDQNSQVIRDYIEDQELIGEYHSNIVQERESDGELDQTQLITEFWNQPIIITTMYQLLMNLFSSKTSYIARMQALSDSVIVLDEAQSLPAKMTYMFNLAVNCLVHYFHSTVVLSSATQPCFGEVKYPILFSNPCDMVVQDEELKAAFHRNRVINRVTPEGMTIQELAEFGTALLEDKSSVLMICNKKQEAKEVYRYLQLICAEGDCELFHLSTSKCMQHRIDTVKEIRECLDARRRMICVSTQLVEAGIDFSFESVVRVMAGMDNLAQAAGRCNRNFDYGYICDVYLVNLKLEKLDQLPDIKLAQEATRGLLEAYRQNPEAFGNDLLSDRSIEDYYQKLFYQMDRDRTLSYPVKCRKYEGMQEELLRLLAGNKKHTDSCHDTNTEYFLHQAFLSAGEEFCVYDSNTVDVLVPYNEEARELITELYSARALNDISYMRKLLKQAKKYTIQIWEVQYRQLENMGVLQVEENGYFTALEPQAYSLEAGLETDQFFRLNHKFCGIKDF